MQISFDSFIDVDNDELMAWRPQWNNWNVLMNKGYWYSSDSDSDPTKEDNVPSFLDALKSLEITKKLMSLHVVGDDIITTWI